MTNLTQTNVIIYKDQKEEIYFNLPKVSDDVLTIKIKDTDCYSYLKVNLTNLEINSALLTQKDFGYHKVILQLQSNTDTNEYILPL